MKARGFLERVCSTWCVLYLVCCAQTATHPAASPNRALHLQLPGTDGKAHTLKSLLRKDTWTVVLFYSDTCPTVKAHDDRINALARQFATDEVAFYWIDSEAGANVTRDTVSARTRGYPFPILIDTDARVADALGARYASHAFILDDAGDVLYSGGIDSDKRTLHEDAVPYLKNALTRVVAGQRPEVSEHPALGCALQR